MAGVTADFKIQNLFGLNDKVVLVTGGGTGMSVVFFRTQRTSDHSDDADVVPSTNFKSWNLHLEV